jgi:hypothetical protein
MKRLWATTCRSVSEKRAHEPFGYRETAFVSAMPFYFLSFSIISSTSP